jgi:hypothetical protein
VRSASPTIRHASRPDLYGWQQCIAGARDQRALEGMANGLAALATHSKLIEHRLRQRR